MNLKVRSFQGIDISSCDVITAAVRPATENYPRCIFVRFAQLELRNKVTPFVLTAKEFFIDRTVYLKLNTPRHS